LLYRGLNNAIFFTIGMADSGITLFFNFPFPFGLLAANDGGIDSIYSRIH
jgi:hypothetical protein